MQAPTIADLLRAPVVRQAIEEAWVESEASNPSRRHEEKINTSNYIIIVYIKLQERGVEPLHLSVQAPKTCASANSATPAGGGHYTVLRAGVHSVSNSAGFEGKVVSGRRVCRMVLRRRLLYRGVAKSGQRLASEAAKQ